MDSPVAEEPSDLRCPLTYCLMRDPVTTSMGNTYERGALMRCWMGPRKRDPLTGEEVLDTVLTPNMLARSQVRPRSLFSLLSLSWALLAFSCASPARKLLS
jgi:U-box domain